MRLDGEWLQCVDGEIRPVVCAELLGTGWVWRGIEFLIDTGADRTVFTARALEDGGLEQLPGELIRSFSQFVTSAPVA